MLRLAINMPRAHPGTQCFFVWCLRPTEVACTLLLRRNHLRGGLDTQITTHLEQCGENAAEITCRVAQQRRGESSTWANLCRIFEHDIVRLRLPLLAFQEMAGPDREHAGW